jgi:hypothetical protein
MKSTWFDELEKDVQVAMSDTSYINDLLAYQ